MGYGAFHISLAGKSLLLFLYSSGHLDLKNGSLAAGLQGGFSKASGSYGYHCSFLAL